MVGCGGNIGSAVVHELFRAWVEVVQGAQVIEIDPRDTDADIYGIGERPRRIARGVLEALQAGLR